MSLFCGSSLLCIVIAHNLVVGMESDFDLHELLKPHLSPALPHWKRTRVSGGQLDHNLKICWPFKPHLTQHYPALEMDKSTGRSSLNAWSWKPQLSPQCWGLANTRLDKTIGRCTNERGKTLPKAWGKWLPKDLTANPKEVAPRLIDKQIILHTGREGGWEFYLLLNKAAYWVQHATEGKCFYTE